MTVTRVFRDGGHLALAVTDPVTPASGDPVRYGSLTGVAQMAKDSVTGNTSVDLSMAVYKLSVKGVNDGGNSAVAVGDTIFYVDADTPKLSKKSSGYFFGYALEVVTSGATTTIQVLHVPSPGSGTLGSGTVGTSNLASGAVTAAKLSTNLAKGFINLPLAGIRLVSANDVAALAASGGIVAKDSAPILERVNGATDKALRLKWAASSVVEVILGSFAYPPDLDDASTLTVNILAKMGGATDTPTAAISYFENTGDTNAGGNTAAMSSTLAKKSVTIAAADVGAYPAVATVGLTPGTHGTDTFELYAAWIEYARAS